MFSKTYKKLFNQVTPNEELRDKTKKLMESKLTRKSQTPKRPLLKRLVLTTSLCIGLVIAMPVMAAKLTSFNKLLHLVSPEIAQLLQPVSLYSESNGIKMEVLGAMTDGEATAVYLTLQDLTDDRIDDTVDLYNYRLNRAHAFTHDLVTYDEITKTATIRMLATGGKRAGDRERLVFRLSSFLSNKEFYPNVQAGIDLKTTIPKNTKTNLVEMNKLPGGGGVFKELDQGGSIKLLKPHQLNSGFNKEIDFLTISSVGYIDEFLHIQTEWEESVDNHGYTVLKDEDGQEVLPIANIYFDLDEQGKTVYGTRYLEEIFRVSIKELEGYSLYGNFTKDGAYVEGDWQVAFTIDNVDKKVLTGEALGIAGINELSISPIGIGLKRRGPTTETNIKLVMEDGTSIDFDRKVSIQETETSITKYIADKPIAIDQINRLIINDHTVPLK